MRIHFKQQTSLPKENEPIIVGVSKTISKELKELALGYDIPIDKLIKDSVISTDIGESTKVVLDNKPFPYIIFVGLGESLIGNLKDVKKLFLSVKSINEKGTLLLDTIISEVEKNALIVSSLIEHIVERNYTFDKFKEKQTDNNKEISIVSKFDVGSSVCRGITLGNSISHTKDLVNTPHSHMNAEHLAEYAEKLAQKVGAEVKIYEKDEIEELGMTAYLAVNKGSHVPPKLIVLKYQGKDEWSDPLALVGKGVTFDTGGYSIKPAASMIGMKSDMGGAASVLGAFEAATRLGLKENLLLVIAATDNMVNEKAYVPDDIVTAANGKTIQISSTDAEGRLTLADALWFVQEKEGAKRVLDLATLTGGMVVALGKGYTGAFTNNDDYVSNFITVSKEVIEPVWHMPIGEHFTNEIKGKVADIDNVGTRQGQSSAAAAFLNEFVSEDTKWIHFDIAGTATDNNWFATGVMVKSIVHFIEKNQSN